MSKSEKIVEKAISHLRRGKLEKAVLVLCDYADTHIRNRATATVFRSEVKKQLSELETGRDPYADTLQVNFENYHIPQVDD